MTTRIDPMRPSGRHRRSSSAGFLDDVRSRCKSHVVDMGNTELAAFGAAPDERLDSPAMASTSAERASKFMT